MTPEHQVAALVNFLEQQVALLPCVPDAKVRPELSSSESRAHGDAHLLEALQIPCRRVLGS